MEKIIKLILELNNFSFEDDKVSFYGECGENFDNKCIDSNCVFNYKCKIKNEILELCKNEKEEDNKVFILNTIDEILQGIETNNELTWVAIRLKAIKERLGGKNE